jgi:UDP-N-acetyl-D-glucosamine dehydrogenase
MKNNKLELYQKLINKNAHISIIGLGYVGLPLLLALGKEGFKMAGIDIDKDKISSLKNNKSYIADISNEKLIKNINAIKYISNLIN